MTLDWTSAEQAQTVTRLEDDPRPAWLWPAEGQKPAWANRAAGLFGAKVKTSGLKRVEPAVPVKGQVSRVLRLGLMGQATLSRVQFLAGRKPLSATCRCTPLQLADGGLYLLMVGVDPIADSVLDAAGDKHAGEDHEAGPESEAPEPEAAPVGLSALVEKLAEDRRLFEPLDDEDDIAPVVPGRDYAKIAHDETVEAGNGENQSDWGLDDAVAHEEAVFAADGNNDAAPERAGLWRVTGRGLTVSRLAYEEAEETAGEVENAVPEPADQASRYNFEELSRILTDR